MTKALETMIGGSHYTKLKIQPMEYSMANGLDACQHSVIKYVTRFRDKAGITDLQKAKHCIDMLIEFELTRAADAAKDFVVDEPAEEKPDFVSAFEKGLAAAAAQECAESVFGPRDADGWYAWHGDETLRPAGRVEYKLFDGWNSHAENAEKLRWSHEGTDADIVKWRPAQ